MHNNEFSIRDSENSETEATVVVREESEDVVCDDEAYVEDVEDNEDDNGVGEDRLVIYLLFVVSLIRWDLE